MDNSLTNYELNESSLKSDSDTEILRKQGAFTPTDTTDDTEPYMDDFSSPSSHISLEEFDNNLPHTVTILRHEESGSKVYLIGTAHFSKESREDVARVIRKVCPDVVVVELCKARTHILSMNEETILKDAQDLSIPKIINHMRANGLYNGFLYCLMLNATAQIAQQTGMAPGGEFRVAYEEARQFPQCKLQLGDRPFHITMQRALSTLSWGHYLKLGWHMLTSDIDVTLEDIEECKRRDIMEEFLEQMAGEFPALRQVFLDERDIFLTYSLQVACKSIFAPGPVIPEDRSSTPFRFEPLVVVGVVGMGHVPGITRLWDKDQFPNTHAVCVIPPPSMASKVFRASFRLVLIGVGSFVVYRYIHVPRSVFNYLQLGLSKMLISIKTGTATVTKYTMQ